MKSNNKSFGHVFFTVLGLILLTLIITAAILFFVCRAKMAGAELHLDDVLRYAQSEPDSRTQHLSFSADAKMTLTLDKSDIWYFLYRYYGEDWLRDTNETLSTLHLELTGLGLDINEDGMTFGQCDHCQADPSDHSWPQGVTGKIHIYKTCQTAEDNQGKHSIYLHSPADIHEGDRNGRPGGRYTEPDR